MNREIKFRAWDDYQKKMYDWNEVCNPEVLTLSNLLNGFIKHIIPLQFADVLDKNDKEIYEGDIVKQTKVGCDDITIDRIVYKGSQFTMDYSTQDLQILMGIGFDIEIIGNIYENPELLEANNG